MLVTHHLLPKTTMNYEKKAGTSCFESKPKSQGGKYAPQIRTTLM